MEVINAAILANRAERIESWIRDGFGGTVPPEIQADLDRFPLGDTWLPNFRRAARAFHHYWIHFEAAKAAKAAEHERTPEQREAARQLLRREPVWTDLAGRRIGVTDRSYNALVEMAYHEAELKRLRAERMEILTDYAERVALIEAGHRTRHDLRAELDALQGEGGRVGYRELQHRRAFYAHALTTNGAPAENPVKDAPDWVAETNELDDVALIRAIIETGPGRLARMGPPPKLRADDEDGVTWAEDLGIHTVVAYWEGERNLIPGSLYNAPIAQLYAHGRAAAVRYPDRKKPDVAEGGLFG